MLSWSDFAARRKEAAGQSAQFFAAQDVPSGKRTPTVMICSHIWWTEQIALAFVNAGCNVLVHFPLYFAYTSEDVFSNFDNIWNGVIQTAREAKVDLILGGNTAAMLVHPKTGEMVQEALNVPLVNWWWDEVRTRPPVARAGMNMGPQDFWRLLGRKSIRNALWDLDVKEELEAGFGPFGGLSNLVHLPLATLPEYWPHGFIPMEERPLAACFLGNCHFTAEWVEADDDPLTVWARDTVRRKIALPQQPMVSCIGDAGGIPVESKHLTGGKAGTDPWIDFVKPWEFLNAAYMHYTRNLLVTAAEEHLRGKLALVGKGWDKLKLRSNMDHAGDRSGVIYGQSKISLNLFGGCVHGGMPLRPFDIGASGGLIVTHDQRELPSLFEPGVECLAFRSKEEMIAIMDRVLAAPADFNRIALAGRARALAEHTWGHRVRRLMAAISGL